MPALTATREPDNTATVVAWLYRRPTLVKATARTDRFLVVRTVPKRTVVGGKHVLVTSDIKVVDGAPTRAEAQALTRQHPGSVVIEVR